jgi:hypothetical protein
VSAVETCFVAGLPPGWTVNPMARQIHPKFTIAVPESGLNSI